MLESEPSNERTLQSAPGERNLLLSHLPEALRRELPVRLINLPEGLCLARAGEPFANVYFPLSGVVALRGCCIDVALIGYEGIVGSSIIAGNHASLFDAIVATSGVAFEVPVDAFSEVAKTESHLRLLASKFEQTLTLHVAQRFLGARLTTQEARLAHHLAMCFDRIESTELVTSHGVLGEALGIRRAGITDSLHCLEGQGMIRAKRGIIELKNIDHVRKAADIAYGPAEELYRMLFGFAFARSS